jgi:hypothetical protein
MKVRCPKCGMSLKCRGENLGKHGKCPRCHHEIVAQWDDVLRPAPPEGQPSRFRPMPIVWGCVAVVGLAGLIASSVGTSKPAPSPSVTPPATLAILPPAVPATSHTVTVAAPVMITPAPTVAPEPVTTTQAPPDADSGSTGIVAGRSAGPARSSTYSSPTPRITGSPSADTTVTGNPIYVGPRGGQYHYSASGRKVYERHRR